MAMYKCRMIGILPDGEVWNSGAHFSSLLTLAECSAAWHTGVENLFVAAPPTGFAALFPFQVGLSGTTSYLIDQATGRALDKLETAIGNVGSGTGGPLPQEVAVCVSLRTAHAGVSGRGRMFLPSPDKTVCDTRGRMTGATTQAIADAMWGLFNHMSVAGFASVLWSVGRPNRPLTHVDVGDVFDAQRRRRDKLVENRTSSVDIVQPADLVRLPYGQSE